MAIHLCGDITGIYYLIVSGLPWSATWQTLKDFVKYPKFGGEINVKYVFIYPSTTDGWIKFCDKEHFSRAYKWLNGRVFQGKAIVADNRNGYTIVNLRDMAPIQTSSTRQQPVHLSSCLEAPIYTQQAQIGYQPCLVPVDAISQLRTPPLANQYQYPVVEGNRQIIQSVPLVPHIITERADHRLRSYSGPPAGAELASRMGDLSMTASDRSSETHTIPLVVDGSR